MDSNIQALLERLDRVETRLCAAENALIDQSAIVTVLSRRAIDAEENFQQLISVVERLCDRTEPAAGSLPTPFETQLTEAFQRQPATPP